MGGEGHDWKVITLYPGVAAGPFILGEPLESKLIEQFCLEVTDTSVSDDGNWITFENDSVTVSVEDGTIATVSCSEVLLFGGVNLLSLSRSEFLASYADEELKITGPIQIGMEELDCLELDNLGLMVWARGEMIDGIDVLG